jgi:hypothetical protein
MSRQITGAVIEELNAPFKLETMEYSWECQSASIIPRSPSVS